MKIKFCILFVLFIQINVSSLAAFEYVAPQSEVINVNEAHLNSDYWINSLKKQQVNSNEVLIIS